MGIIFRAAELNDLYEMLSPEERDELLQSLLIAAPRGGEAMGCWRRPCSAMQPRSC